MLNMGDAGRAPHAILSTTSVPGSSPRLRVNVDESRLQQLLREEMRVSLLSKRHPRGGSEAKLDESGMADEERKERRREQNRRAAQRCRRKKRMNQLSVLQNYEWIITHNQQLQQEVNQLRQEMTRLNSVLKAHRNACTCAHVHKGPLRAQTANVKMETGKDSPGPKTGYSTPPPPPPAAPPASIPQPSPLSASRCLPMSSCQYQLPLNENMVNEVSVSPLSQQQQPTPSSLPMSNNCFYGSPIQAGIPSYASPLQADTPQNMLAASHSGSASLPEAPTGCHVNGPPQEKDRHHVAELDSRYTAPAMEGSLLGARAAVQDRHEQPPGGFRDCLSALDQVQMAGASQRRPPPQDVDGPYTVLEHLAGLSGSVGSCIFQAQAATPLSADGRCSISSVSSDVSGGSEPPNHDVVMTTAEHRREGEFHVTGDVTPHDLSQLLSQINQSDLLFLQEGGLDEVFSSQVVGTASLPQHFLHSL